MKKKILIVDDEELLTRTFSILLGKKLGYDVRFAVCGQDALAAAEREVFDLIVCDIRMPGMDGVEVLRAVRELYLKKGQKVPPEIVMTGFADAAKEDEVRGLSPAGYLIKPFDNEVLIAEIQRLLV